MKKLSIITFTLSLLLLGSCNKDIELGDPVSLDHFYKLYGSYHWEFSNAVIETGDGGLVWVGYSSEEYQPDQIEENFTAWPYICKVSPDGMVDWDTTYLEDYPQSIAHDVKQNNQQTEMYVSISEKQAEDTFLLHLLPISMTGEFDEVVSTTLLASRVIAANVIVRSDDSLRVIAQVENIVDAEVLTSVCIFKLNAQNNLEMTYELPFTEELYEPIRTVSFAEDKIILSATVYENDGKNTDVRVLNVIDQEIIWDMVYGETGVSETSSEVKIIDENIVIAGNYIDSEDSYVQTITIDPISLQGDSVQYTTELSGLTCNSFDVNERGNYVFTGGRVTGSDRSDIFFLEATKAGAEVLSKSFGSNGEETGFNIGQDIISIGTDGYFLVGQLQPINNTDVVIFKLNEVGSWID